jgi:hypothetical protein
MDSVNAAPSRTGVECRRHEHGLTDALSAASGKTPTVSTVSPTNGSLTIGAGHVWIWHSSPGLRPSGFGGATAMGGSCLRWPDKEALLSCDLARGAALLDNGLRASRKLPARTSHRTASCGASRASPVPEGGRLWCRVKRVGDFDFAGLIPSQFVSISVSQFIS